MTEQFQQIITFVDDYLRTDDYWPLWQKIAGPEIEKTQTDQLSASETALYGDLYDMVYMGQPDSASPEDATFGVIGGKELLSLISKWRESALR